MGLLFAVCVLAAYRLARALTLDSIGDWIRTKAVARYGDSGLGELATCPHCAGVWLSALVVLGAAVFRLLPFRRVPFWIAAVAGGQSVLTSLIAAIEDA